MRVDTVEHIITYLSISSFDHVITSVFHMRHCLNSEKRAWVMDGHGHLTTLRASFQWVPSGDLT